MDKKNTILGILFIGAALFLMPYLQMQQPPAPQPAAEESPTQTAGGEAARSLSEATNAVADGGNRTPGPAASLATMEQGEAKAPEQTFVQPSNGYIEVEFTSHGGGIKKVSFLQFDEALDSDEPYIFNNFENPSLGLDFLEADRLGREGPVSHVYDYKLELNENGTVVFSTELKDLGLRIVRGYTIVTAQDTEVDGKPDPYLIKHQTRIINMTDRPVAVPDMYLNLGALRPTEGDIYGQYQNVAHYIDGKATFIQINRLTGSSGFLGFGQRPEVDNIHQEISGIEWLSVKNQFFTGLLTPRGDAKIDGYYIDKIDLGSVGPQGRENYAMRARALFEVGVIPAGGERLINADYYVGPKDYFRLSKLGQEQDLVMQLAPNFFLFGWIAIISKFLLTLLLGLNSFISNWGLTIIVMTFMIKLAMWPLTQVQVKSAKRMAKIQGPMAELREKYKDKPQLMQQKTMELFKQHKVNPAAGCLPLLIQIPIFLALFYTLRTSADLRFESFLWAEDLSRSDTISWLPELPQWIPFFGGPIHVLPLLMGITMYFQMQMTPTPTTDNAQAKLLKLMPFIFLFFCYKFPAGLVIYWTTQNLLTILQQWITNRRKDDDVLPANAVPAGGAPAGNKFVKKKAAKKAKA